MAEEKETTEELDEQLAKLDATKEQPGTTVAPGQKVGPEDDQSGKSKEPKPKDDSDKEKDDSSVKAESDTSATPENLAAKTNSYSWQNPSSTSVKDNSKMYVILGSIGGVVVFIGLVFLLAFI